MGPNGAGKTTLIKTLIGREKPDAGEVKLGHKVQVGYYDQGLESLTPETTVVRAVWPEDEPDWVERDVRDLLARFGLARRDRLPDRRPALRRREGARPRWPGLAATGGQPPGHGRADQPPRHLGVRRAGALDPRVRGDRPGRQPRPLLPQPGGRPPDRRRRRPGPRDRGGLRDLPAAGAAGGRGRRPAKAAPASVEPSQAATAAKAGEAEAEVPYRKTADLEREIAEVEAEVAELEDQPWACPRPGAIPIKARATQSGTTTSREARHASTSTGKKPSS